MDDILFALKAAALATGLIGGIVLSVSLAANLMFGWLR